MERLPDREPVLTGWIVENRRNDYEPGGDVSAVRALLAKGADPRRALPQRESLVELAVANGRANVVALLNELMID